MDWRMWICAAISVVGIMAVAWRMSLCFWENDMLDAGLDPTEYL